MKKHSIVYMDMFWLFMIGNMLGVLLEGIWCVIIYGRWETHVVTIWGPFCLIYGFGAVLFYILSVKLKNKTDLFRFAVIALVASSFELICGLILEYGFGMRAWDYSGEFLNYRGHICAFMTMIWGIVGLIFARFAVPRFDKMFEKMRGRGWRIACVSLSVFMILNISITSISIFRWSARHEGHPPKNVMEKIIDNIYDDNVMSHKFCKWRFIK